MRRTEYREQAEKIQAFSSFQKRLVASGLVCVAFLASGCNILRKDVPQRGFTPNEVEAQLNRTLLPTMASIGKKAAHYAKTHPDKALWYKPASNQYELLIGGFDDFGVDVTKKRNVPKKRFLPGDVEEIVIRSTYVNPDIIDPKGIKSSEVRSEVRYDGRTMCTNGIAAESEFLQGTFEDLSAFTSVDKCTTTTLGFGPFNMEMSSQHAASQITEDLEKSFQAAIKK